MERSIHYSYTATQVNCPKNFLDTRYRAEEINILMDAPMQEI